MEQDTRTNFDLQIKKFIIKKCIVNKFWRITVKINGPKVKYRYILEQLMNSFDLKSIEINIFIYFIKNILYHFVKRTNNQ